MAIFYAYFSTAFSRFNDSEREILFKGLAEGKVGKDVGYGILQSLFMDHILRLHPLHRKCMDNKINPKPIAKVLGLVKPTSALA